MNRGRKGFLHLLEIPARPEYLSTARLFVSAVGRHFGCGEEIIDDLKIAVSEACNNAIAAHRSTSQAAPMRVSILVDQDNLICEMADQGGGFQTATAPATGDDFESLPERGFGLTLIRALFPDVEISSGSDGTTVRVRADL